MTDQTLFFCVRPSSNEFNIVGQQLPTLLDVTCCCMLLGVVAQSLKPVKVLSQQLPTFLLLCQLITEVKCNNVGWGHAYALHMVSKVLRVASFPGWTACPNVAAFICTPLPTRTQQLATLLAQQC